VAIKESLGNKKSDHYSCSPLRAHGDRSSMVELQIVVLAVAGSSPVGHPMILRTSPGYHHSSLSVDMASLLG
jgi:hypothetical protein